ncbi:MarR family winged helix-turn-helix transcriptional regulator [Planctomicrobium sp. SH668]|uniref:MarR family winged helix-turn-helix transcriptional regulator n=1 Tax=Planctomicrobium sp. SH668 TaxID=3448126 RepID=UPI003F5B8F90
MLNVVPKLQFDSPQQEAFLNLWRTFDKLKEIEESLFSRFELSAQQYNTLRLLSSVHPEPMPTLSLGARLISRAPDMTRLLDKLASRGLIQRVRREDNRRVVNVSLTQAGLDLLDELELLVRECHQRQLGHLSHVELHTLTRLLKEARAPHEDRHNLSIAGE